MAIGKDSMTWADEDDDDFLPPRQESAVNAQGIKTVVEWKLNSKGEKEKTTSKVKVFSEKTRLSKAAIARKEWFPFGDALTSGDNSNRTVKSQEDIFIEDPKVSAASGAGAAAINADLAASMEAMGRRNRLRKMGLLDVVGEEPPPEDEPLGGALGGLRSGAPDKYMPPQRKNLMGSGDSEPMEDRSKIRVTNVSEEATEADLRDLFGRFGKINRIYLAKDPLTYQSRGFAFVSYQQERDAENAMNNLQGHGYDHLILKLEWAKPSQRDMSGGAPGGGLSSMRTSGYGQKLAQDTTEKVSYASNLTKNRA